MRRSDETMKVGRRGSRMVPVDGNSSVRMTKEEQRLKSQLVMTVDVRLSEKEEEEHVVVVVAVAVAVEWLYGWSQEQDVWQLTGLTVVQRPTMV